MTPVRPMQNGLTLTTDTRGQRAEERRRGPNGSEKGGQREEKYEKAIRQLVGISRNRDR